MSILATPLDDRFQLSLPQLRTLGFLSQGSAGLARSVRLLLRVGPQSVMALELSLELYQDDDGPDEVGSDEEPDDHAELAGGVLRLDFAGQTGAVEQRIGLVRLPSNLGVGGGVLYFVCPSTGRRCRSLYWTGSGFTSRYALAGVGYRRQRACKSARAFDQRCAQLLRLEAYQRSLLVDKTRRCMYGGKPTRFWRAYQAVQ